MLTPAATGAANLANVVNAAAVANLHIPDTQTTIAINLPPGTSDIDFYIVAPTRYSYAAVGFGGQMANTLMLVAYAAQDGQRKRISAALLSRQALANCVFLPYRCHGQPSTGNVSIFNFFVLQRTRVRKKEETPIMAATEAAS